MNKTPSQTDKRVATNTSVQRANKTLNRSQQALQTRKTDQENTQRSHDELEQVNKLQLKLLSKNETMAKLKEENIQNHLLWQDEKRNLLQERNDMERQINILKEQITDERQQTLKTKVQFERLTAQLKDTSRVKQHLEQNTSTFDKVQQQLQQDLSEALKELTNNKFIMQAKDNKILSQDEIIIHLESKIQKLKQKMESDRKDNLEREMGDAKKRKLKHQELTDTINQLQDRQQDFAAEVRLLKSQNEELKVENAALKDPKAQYHKQPHKFQMERDELDLQTNKMNQIIKSQQYELEQHHADLTALSESLSRKNQTIQHIEQMYQEECERYTKLKVNAEAQEAELRTYKNLVEKMEKQNQLILDAQSHDFDNIEVKVEKISKEITTQKQDNDKLRHQNQQLRIDVSDLISERDTLNQQIKHLKARNATIETQLVHLDDKLREIVKEKNIDVALLRKGNVSRPGTGARLKSVENLDKLRRMQKAMDSDSDSSFD